jgi:Transglutaminase-like superfamily
MDARKVGFVVAAGVLVSAFAWAAPVLHEYFDVAGVTPPPTSRNDAAKSDPSARGDSRATESAGAGVGADKNAAADSSARSRAEANNASRQALAAVSDPDRYQLDANTSRPDNVSYSDPFTPSIPPFKRMYAYDAVNAELELVVADATLRVIGVGGRVLEGDDQFLGDLPLQLGADDLVRIPSVGPGARVIGFKLEPALGATLFADSADNWFIRASEGGAVRLLMHLAIDNEVFGSNFKVVSWDALSKSLPTRPNILFDSAEEVLRRIGASQQRPPNQALASLVEYFREFAPSDEELAETGPALYERIALGQKGVCRHRAFAFVVTALALGLPSRFVHNEAHAWVEVFDTELWHRIDLGGAAGHAGLDQPLSIRHVAPGDPFPWPPQSERGTDMLSRSDADGSDSDSDSGDANPANTAPPKVDSTSPAPPAAPPPAASDGPGPSSSELLAVPAPPPPGSAADPGVSEPMSTTADGAVPGEVVFTLSSRDVTRGARIALNGRVSAVGADCSLRRINIVLHAAQGNDVPIGALVTDAQGKFSGEIVVPDSVPVGDYDVQVVPGEHCALTTP